MFRRSGGRIGGGGRFSWLRNFGCLLCDVGASSGSALLLLKQPRLRLSNGSSLTLFLLLFSELLRFASSFLLCLSLMQKTFLNSASFSLVSRARRSFSSLSWWQTDTDERSVSDDYTTGQVALTFFSFSFASRSALAASSPLSLLSQGFSFPLAILSYPFSLLLLFANKLFLLGPLLRLATLLFFFPLLRSLPISGFLLRSGS